MSEIDTKFSLFFIFIFLPTSEKLPITGVVSVIKSVKKKRLSLYTGSVNFPTYFLLKGFV